MSIKVISTNAALKICHNMYFFTGKQRLLLLLLLLLLMLLFPARRLPKTQTACHISLSTDTSPPVVQGLPIRAEMPRSSAEVSDN